jgi:hypothetical protein
VRAGRSGGQQNSGAGDEATPGGVLGTVKSVLVASCGESNAPAPNILAASCGELRRIAEMPGSAGGRLAASGLVKRTIRALNDAKGRCVGPPASALGALRLTAASTRLRAWAASPWATSLWASSRRRTPWSWR